MRPRGATTRPALGSLIYGHLTWHSRSDFGLGAEEVEKVASELDFYGDGQVEGVKYDRIGVVLINALKEQQAQIEQQKEQLKRQQEQN